MHWNHQKEREVLFFHLKSYWRSCFFFPGNKKSKKFSGYEIPSKCKRLVADWTEATVREIEKKDKKKAYVLLKKGQLRREVMKHRGQRSRRKNKRVAGYKWKMKLKK